MVRHVLRTVVVSHRETVRDVGREAAEVSAHALADRLQSLEACGSRMGVNADALSGTMIHRDKYRRRPFYDTEEAGELTYDKWEEFEFDDVRYSDDDFDAE